VGKFLGEGGQHIFLLFLGSRGILGPNQPPHIWVPKTTSPGKKQLGHEAEHSPPSTAEDAWSCTSTF